MIRQAFDTASAANEKVPVFELPECTAMSQGYIGFHLQKGIKKELRREGMPWHVATVVTQIVVDKDDPAFLNPTKPIGSFYTAEEALKMMRENPKLHMKEDAGRGYRQMVASPKPVDIAERDSILNLLDHEFIVIACGGGGIPVMEQGYNLRGASAIIEKDLATGLLAKEIDADVMMILTSVDNVTLNYGTPQEQPISHMTIDQARDYISQGQFEFASMLPKVSASIDFLESGKGRKAIITTLDKAKDSLKGHAGTVIE